MVAIFLVSAQSSLPMPEEIWDKGLHVGAYGLFGVLCLRAFHGGLRPLRLRESVTAVAWSLGYALLDEWHQAHVPGRVASVLDWLADALGTLLSLPLVVVVTSLGRLGGGKIENDDTPKSMETRR